MTATDNRPGSSQQRDNDARDGKRARENATSPLSPPVRQHNPEDKGINPDQKGPVQPDNK